jgi:nicotinate-nucleotide pyrophosphorylase (carboxylating)
LIREDHLNRLDTSSRQTRLKSALFRGDTLTLANPEYFKMVRVFIEELLHADRDPEDITSAALAAGKKNAVAQIIANEPGVLAGIEEAFWYFTNFGLAVERAGADGQCVKAGQAFLRLEGDSDRLLSLERVGLNLLQRMSGIATFTQRLQNIVRGRVGDAPPNANIIATRKTPWGLLDKRAAHLGGGGTHRLGLGDAILIKTNHLRLFAPDESDAIPIALNRAWGERQRSAFIEVEVTGLAGALSAGHTFRNLRRSEPEADSYPCLVMLDNRSAAEAGEIIAALKTEGVWDDILIEVSGGISEAGLAAYADAGVDAISVGALTHSCKALDLRCRLEVETGKNVEIGSEVRFV